MVTPFLSNYLNGARVLLNQVLAKHNALEGKLSFSCCFGSLFSEDGGKEGGGEGYLNLPFPILLTPIQFPSIPFWWPLFHFLKGLLCELFKVARYSLVEWGATVLKSDFWLLNSIRLLRYLDAEKGMLEVYQKCTFIEINTNIRKFLAIFLTVVFKENAYYRGNEKTFFLDITLDRCWNLKDFREKISDKSSPHNFYSKWWLKLLPEYYVRAFSHNYYAKD